MMQEAAKNAPLEMYKHWTIEFQKKAEVCPRILKRGFVEKCSLI